MKSLADYKKEVEDEMVQNQTISFHDGHYNVPEDISYEEVKEALIRRYAEKLNDYVREPFGRAKLSGRNPRPAIERAIKNFADAISSECEMLYLTPPDTQTVFAQLVDKLEDHYKECLG